MNRTLLRTIPAAALSGLLLATAAWSMGSPHDFDSQKMLERMTDHLQLSDDQEQKIGAILAENSDQAKLDHQRMMEIREALESQRESFNAGETQRLADEMGEITTRFVYQSTEKRARVYQELNPEQQEQLADMHQRRDEHREKRWSRKKD
jgi:periplasmic protein CpxP/Spy